MGVFLFVFASMSHRQPVRVSEIDQFHTVVDARSPAEFALDHIPGAINCPVLDDAERALIGTLYKQKGPFEAKRLGAALVAANLARHLKTTLADRPAHWRPLVYCWRGGMRSGSMVTWLRLIGWDAQQLAGGYKAYRHHVVEQLRKTIPQLQLRVVCGATGSAKTRLLHALQAQGAQIIDLEGLACHKGSLLGSLPGTPQPSQKAFDTQLLDALAQLDLRQPVFIEGESAKIGRLAVPLELIAHMRAAPVVEVQATPQARLAFLLHDYAYLGEDVPLLCERLALLKELQGKEAVTRWQAWAQAGNLADLFAELMALHYDPQYQRSQSRNFVHWGARQSVQADRLDADGIAALAQQVLGLPSLSDPAG